MAGLSTRLGCNLLNSYIKPQRYRYGIYYRDGCNLLNSYIKPQRMLAK